MTRKKKGSDLGNPYFRLHLNSAPIFKILIVPFKIPKMPYYHKITFPTETLPAESIYYWTR